MSEAGYQAVDPPLRKYRKHKICIGVSVCCTVVWLGIAIGFPFLLASLIDSQAKSGIVMTPDNENLWAHIPGGTNTITYRNFTFFNFTNPREFLYQGQKPLFREVSGYSYIEKQDFINIEYLDGGNEVKYDYWLHFEEASTTRNLNEKVKVINLGPVGFWNQLKSTDMPTFAIQGFGQLTFELRATFKSTVLGQGVAQQFLPNQTNWLPLAGSAGISSKVATFLWTDLQYGLNNPNNYEIWLAAARDRFSADYRILLNYFGLEPSQMKVILDQMSSWVAGLEGIIDNWFCGNSTDGQIDCND